MKPNGQVLLRGEDSIAWVTLAHPGKLNAMSRAMWAQLREVFRQIHAGPWRCAVLVGEGDAFCAGGDISEYPGFRFDEAALRRFHEEEVWGGLQAVLDCDVPVLAQISGACMGAGVEIAACCDIRVAALDARFGAPIAKLGFPMAPREARLVAQAAGAATAREMLLQAAVLDAATMERRGFLHEVCAPAALAARVRERALAVAALAPQAARLNKQTLRGLGAAGAGPQEAYAYADSREHREGIAAFLEKRKPAF